MCKLDSDGRENDQGLDPEIIPQPSSERNYRGVIPDAKACVYRGFLNEMSFNSL